MTIETVATAIAEKGFSGLLSNLASSYMDRKTKSLSNNIDEIKTDLSDHLSNTFNKCIEIKTILSEKKAEKTLLLYVDQFFQVGDEEVDQYTLVSKIKDGCCAVITGTGGGGKSMFMRYLWLSLFENPQGKIPFFLELRQLNLFTHASINDFIYHSIIKSGSSISQNNFTKSLKTGEFILFFDGFDEINHDQRAKVEQMILSLRDNYPALTVIVTSRPDERFIGWHHFEIVKVLPLKKPQVVELINKAPYPEEYKSIFISQIDKLFVTHQTFLTTPLLAYMMLVTFSYSRDIPNKIFLFYEQAFDALYSRHDLTKGGYKRKLYTNLERQVFIRLISYFCLKGYFDQAFEFTEAELNDTIDHAKSIEPIIVDNDSFIRDMSESVCMLKKEGIIYSFTHRSFQEYFSANCIARVASRNVDKMFSEFSSRYNDSVMQMVYDINVDLFREKYIIPLRKKYSSFFNKKRTSDLFEAFAERTGLIIEYHIEMETKKKGRRTPRRIFGPSMVQGEGTLNSLFYNSLKIMDDKASQKLHIAKLHEDDIKFGRFAASILRATSQRVLRIYVKDGKFQFEGVGAEETEQLRTRLNNAGYIQFMRFNVSSFHKFINKEVESYQRITRSFSELFS